MRFCDKHRRYKFRSCKFIIIYKLYTKNIKTYNVITHDIISGDAYTTNSVADYIKIERL